MRNGCKGLAGVLATFVLAAAGCRQKPATPAEQAPQPTAPAAVQIGGEDVLTLTRKATNNGSKPEFLSVTLLPGRGMNMLQVTAAVPGKGEIPLLRSPSVKEAASQLNGTGRDQLGNMSFSLGGAFLIPYPNRIVGERSPDGKSVITQWHGHTLALPANFPSKNPGGPVVAIHGLITQAKVEDLQTQTTADGQTVTGVIHAGDFGGHWLSDTDLNLTIALTGEAVDATITAKNVGKEPEPMSIGWHPYFQILSGHRAQTRLHIPASMMAPVNNYGDAFPTGELKPVKGTDYDYNAPDGVALDDHFLDDNFSHLQRTNGAAEVKLIDPDAHYGLTVSALSPEIKTIQVYSPKTASFVAIEDQFNYVDPFGKQWKGMDTGMVTLRPGQSVTWKVRLGLFTPGQ
ncbi:MAG TPA: aldose 1-epimerase [Acidobacteriaceae bacterium]|nr:aldose 1-epimerase [Acidobacteriaceae bacterium]